MGESNTNDDPRDLVQAAVTPWWQQEDFWANLLGGTILAAFLAMTMLGFVAKKEDLTKFLARPTTWVDQPTEGLFKGGDASVLWGIGRVALGAGILFTLAVAATGTSPSRFLTGFLAVMLLACIAHLLAQQKTIAAYNIEYALWAIAVGLAISNTVGTPSWIKPALRTELFIKTGLVVYGAEIMLHLLLKLAIPGIAISWVVTPIVFVSTYIIGQRWIGIESRSLNLTISADMSVCGVSAAIATAAACRAKKEELSLAIGISLAFTAIMMVVQPAFIKAVGMDPVVGGAWIGGTIDSTGAVGAAGQVLGDHGRFMAITIKMIQNMLIGVMALAVAIYWSRSVDSTGTTSVGIGEIWRRFPKFIIGFLAASIVFTFLASAGGKWGESAMLVKDTVVKSSRDWLFSLAFVSIGLETDFRSLAGYLKGGKPVLLYVVGQTINLTLSLAMCWLMLRVVYPNFAETLSSAMK
jgi:uncharacterized membrane protein YadS